MSKSDDVQRTSQGSERVKLFSCISLVKQKGSFKTSDERHKKVKGSVNNKCLYFLPAKAAIKTLLKHKSSKLQDKDMKQHPTEDTAKKPIA